MTFKFRDYRLDGDERTKTMTLETGEFIRRLLMHVLPKGLRCIRHAACPGQASSPTRAGGLLARSSTKAATLERARAMIAVATPAPRPPTFKPAPEPLAADGAPAAVAEKPVPPCPCCGCRMVIIATFEAGMTPRHRPTVPTTMIRVDTS